MARPTGYYGTVNTPTREGQIAKQVERLVSDEVVGPTPFSPPVDDPGFRQHDGATEMPPLN